MPRIPENRLEAGGRCEGPFLRLRPDQIQRGIGARLGSQLRFDTALSYARHRYVNWITATANFSGRNIETAPKAARPARRG